MTAARWVIHVGNAVDVLKGLPTGSVHCCVTSPPYWGLRDYGTARWDGGDPSCDHHESKPARIARSKETSGLEGGKEPVGRSHVSRDRCARCGARRVDDQIGLEDTPESFVERLRLVFSEVRRVLRDDGTLWLNLGDSYAGSWGAQGASEHMAGRTAIAARQIAAARRGASRTGAVHTKAGLKPKDLVGIPWAVAFALRASGWVLRSDIIWYKPNPLPESVLDRPSKAHEYIFLFSKARRMGDGAEDRWDSQSYFYDADAIREAHRDKAGPPTRFGATGQANEALKRDADGHARSRMVSKIPPSEGYNPLGRNARTVWEIPTQPFPEAHFATFPEELARRCILAGTSARGACGACGAPWIRKAERAQTVDGKIVEKMPATRGTDRRAPRNNPGVGHNRIGTVKLAESWAPSCTCGAAVVPCVVLDPFAGAGTSGVVACKAGRKFVGVELNFSYAAMARARIEREFGSLLSWAEGGAP